ncbi:hypothetical protein NXW11_24570 [Bacteroides thetaiotaomicron]|uniref:hypothetical protein n=1 Tax=Bacteroides thetaiotaomicron TaxID=818 RepID=UPI0021666E3A|nr:hypothetical protein [Bacteroides thetaiotaomicron]MCS2621063.1 hypothetical protein [Bacteroides thetaiotaomicron]
MALNDNSTEGPENLDVPEIKPRYVWIDAAANFPDYMNNMENISTDMVKVKTQGLLDIIADVCVPLQEMFCSTLLQ